MNETLKRLLPVSLRNFLRPAVHRMVQTYADWSRQMKEEPLWPKPAEWKCLKSQLSGQELSITDLFRLSQKEFGTVQIEVEIIEMLQFVSQRQPRAVAEIGMKLSGNTFLFSQVFQQLECLLGVDTRLNNTPKLRYCSRLGQRLKFIQADSHRSSTVRRFGRLLRNRQLDFLFLDGDHSYKGVSEDFILYYHFVRPGGLISLHDILPDEFARFGRRSPGSGLWGGGVYMLWNRLKDHFVCHEFISEPSQYAFGIGLIEKPSSGEFAGDLPKTIVTELRTLPTGRESPPVL